MTCLISMTVRVHPFSPTKRLVSQVCLAAAFRALVEENVKSNVEKIASSAVIRRVCVFFSSTIDSLNIGLDLQEPDNATRH